MRAAWEHMTSADILADLEIMQGWIMAHPEPQPALIEPNPWVGRQ